MQVYGIYLGPGQEGFPFNYFRVQLNITKLHGPFKVITQDRYLEFGFGFRIDIGFRVQGLGSRV